MSDHPTISTVLSRRAVLAGTPAVGPLAAVAARAKPSSKVNAALNSLIATDRDGQTLTHFWSKCVGAGRANEGLRATWLEQLEMAREDRGFQYVRFHGLFHDDMAVFRLVDDKAVYNWQLIDLFDRLLKIGVKPFVELGFMPKDLASTDRAQFWWKGNVDYAPWRELVAAFAEHCIGRYRIKEVWTWYFEVWNELNLKTKAMQFAEAELTTADGMLHWQATLQPRTCALITEA